MARCMNAFMLAALLLAAGAHSDPGVPGNPNYDSDTVQSGSAATRSGLNLVQSSNGNGAFSGRTLSSSSATGATGLLNDYTDASGWSEDFTVVDMAGDTLNGVANAVVIKSKVTDTIMQNYMWVADTNGKTVYKIDTTKTGSAAIVGSYASKPSTAPGNPVAFAVLSNGDAFVGNAFTFGGTEAGSLAKVQADNSANCGGTTSKTITPISWSSGTTSPDACVKAYSALPDTDVSIAAVGADGADNVWTIAVNEDVRFQGYLSLYRTSADGSTVDTFLSGYHDVNRIVGTTNANSDGPGAPGGSGLVIDKWGYMWSGGGTYIKDFGGATGRKYILIRFDTNHPDTSKVQYFAVNHETQALAFDNDGNLWVAGAGGMTLFNIDPNAIGLMTGLGVDTTGTAAAIVSPIDLIAAQGDTCGGDTCCEEGGYNTGIVVSRANGDVYVANECPTGNVLLFSSDGTKKGSVINVGSYPSGISIDAVNKVWVPILVTTGADQTEARATTLISLATGADPTPTSVSDIAVPFLGGTGDMTGRYTAQPPASGTWTWVHDTSYTSYDKWNGAKARWTATNGTDQVTVSVVAETSNSASGPWTGTQPVGTGSGSTYTTLSLPAGQFVRFTGSFTRAAKAAPEVGPQAFGVTPLLTKFEIIPRNNYPTALCSTRSVNADNPTSQSDSTYGSNANGRLCGAPLSSATAIDDGSYDPDTAELDTIVPIQPTSAFYSPSLYALLAANSYTQSTLTVNDAHGGQNTCAADVIINDVTPPAWKSQYNINNATRPFSGALGDISTLCIWPPNFKYYCWLDVTSNTNDQVIPLYDNCGGSIPIGKKQDGFICQDSDPRTKAGDCVLYQQGTKYNLCVKAQRRTTYTNTARVYQANFQVTDGSGTNTYSRQVRIPPLWQFQTSGDCPRPTYKAPAGTSAYYTNSARK